MCMMVHNWDTGWGRGPGAQSSPEAPVETWKGVGLRQAGLTVEAELERRLLPAAQAWPSPPAPSLTLLLTSKWGPIPSLALGMVQAGWLLALEAADGQMVIAPRGWERAPGLAQSRPIIRAAAWGSLALPLMHPHACGQTGQQALGKGVPGLL